MSKEYCEHGTCKGRRSYLVSQLNVESKEKREYFLCKNHLSSLLSHSSNMGLIVEFKRMESKR